MSSKLFLTLFLGAVFLTTAAPASARQVPCDLGTVLSSNGLDGDNFGAAVDVSGDRMIVGAPGNDALGANTGAAYVFENNAGVWSEQLLFASNAGIPEAAFGLSVAIEGDLAVVGAPGDTLVGFNTGSAYVFERISGVWTEVQKLNASNAALGDLYGISVSVQGERIVVGACQLSQFQIFGTGTGKLFVYERVAGTWVEDELVLASDLAAGDRFGVAHDMEGDTLLISAENKNIFGPTSGAAYLFEKIAGTWTELDRIEPSDGAAGDFFAMGLALEGDFVAIGAPEHAAGAPKTGAVYMFERGGNTWTETQKLLVPTPAAQDWFGRCVDLQNQVVWSGAHNNDLTGTGSAHAFRYDGASWNHAAELIASDTVVGDQHGYAVAVDGGRLVVSSRKDGGTGSTYEYSSTLDSITPLGCDLNPAGSLEIVSGTSSLGDNLVVAVHNPSGTQTPGATVGFIAITNQALLLPSGCGVPFAWDMTGGPAGELLVDPGTLLQLVVTPIWAGSPVTSTIVMPPACGLIGTDVAVQAVMLDTAAGAGGVKFGLTRGFEVVLGQ